MIIRYAEEKNFIELRQFYDGMCKVLSEKDFLPEGDKGGFPPDEMIKDAIKERNQFIGIEDGRIVAAYIMNHDRDEASVPVSLAYISTLKSPTELSVSSTVISSPTASASRSILSASQGVKSSASCGQTERRSFISSKVDKLTTVSLLQIIA